MDKNFLNKVVDQIVSETRVDYEKEKVYTSFSFPHPSLSSSPFSYIFTTHCKDVYGLNYEETEYVWNEYIKIVRDKIEDNG
jgi:hypothetical protein